MNKIIILLGVVLVLLSFGCKKEEKTATKDNQTQIEAPKTDMEPFKKSLSILKNPQYDLLYKLIEKGGINAVLEEDVKIAYPIHAKRLINNEPEITIKKGATPLGIAALFCTPSLVNDLIEKGADLKAKTNGMEISALIIQCGEAEQAGMFENYLKAARKYERENDDVYKNKPELYAANAMIYVLYDNESIPYQTILNYAVENKLQDAIEVILKYAGGINYFQNENNNPNNMLPIITAIKYNNMEALRLFFERTGSLFANMQTLDGVKVSLIDYLFYNSMDSYIKEANIPVSSFFKSLVNGYKQSAAGIKEIKEIIESDNLTATTQEDIILENGKIEQGATVAHIAAAMRYNALLKAMAFYNDATDILNIQKYNGDTPLHVATKFGNVETAKILLEGGAYLDILNNENKTPIDVAVRDYEGGNKIELVKLLMTSAGNTKVNHALQMNYETKTQAENNQKINELIEKYNIQSNHFTVRGYINYMAKKYAKEELHPSIVRIMQGGIDNQLPFAIYMLEQNPFPKGATPLIAAAVACSDNTAKYLMLANVDADIRIDGEYDLKYNAYDFADRISRCEAVKETIKNPNAFQIKFDDFLSWDIKANENENNIQEKQESKQQVIDDTVIIEETPEILRENTEDNADVELIIEKE